MAKWKMISSLLGETISPSGLLSVWQGVWLGFFLRLRLVLQPQVCLQLWQEEVGWDVDVDRPLCRCWQWCWCRVAGIALRLSHIQRCSSHPISKSDVSWPACWTFQRTKKTEWILRAVFLQKHSKYYHFCWQQHRVHSLNLNRFQIVLSLHAAAHVKSNAPTSLLYLFGFTSFPLSSLCLIIL